MNLKSFSDLMFEAIRYARQDRQAMLDAVNTKEESTAVKAELGALKALEQLLKENVRSVGGRVEIKDLEKLSLAGDPDDTTSSGNSMWMAICYAIQDREAMFDGVNTRGEAKSVATELRSFYRLRRRLFPGRKTFLEQFYEGAVAVPISELLKRKGG